MISSVAKKLFEDVRGRELDAGCGTGRTFAYYPPKAEVTGIDLSPAMLARAEKRRAKRGLSVPLLEMDICRTSFGDNPFDAGIASFLSCILPNDRQLAALIEIKRVLKPGGRVRLLEYTWSKDPIRRRIQKLWEPWVRRVRPGNAPLRARSGLPRCGGNLPLRRHHQPGPGAKIN